MANNIFIPSSAQLPYCIIHCVPSLRLSGTTDTDTGFVDTLLALGNGVLLIITIFCVIYLFLHPVWTPKTTFQTVENNLPDRASIFCQLTFFSFHLIYFTLQRWTGKVSVSSPCCWTSILYHWLVSLLFWSSGWNLMIMWMSNQELHSLKKCPSATSRYCKLKRVKMILTAKLVLQGNASTLYNLQQHAQHRELCWTVSSRCSGFLCSNVISFVETPSSSSKVGSTDSNLLWQAFRLY